MLISYSGRSKPSALKIAEASDGRITAVRSGNALINWGRNRADTRLNPDISNATNKRVMRELFASHDVPMPRLHRVSQVNGRLNFGLAIQFPLVGRPDQHTMGRGFWKCNNPRDVERALRGTRKKRAATHFMQFVEAPREYRVHVFLGKSIRISEKNFNADRSDYTTKKPEHRVRHVREAAKQAVAALGMDFGAVDVLADEENCWVLEVNAAPGIGGSVPRLYARVFQEWEDGEWDD